MPTTFVKLDRNLLSWGWFHDSNTLKLWLFIIISANVVPQMFQGVEIKRGSLATSHASLAREMRLTISQIRTALKHLEQTGSVSVRKYPKFLEISVLNYDLYQGIYQLNTADQSQENRSAIADQSQENRSAIAAESQQYNNEIMKECNNEIMKECEEKKHAHGKLNNVFITDSEYNAFVSEYPDTAEDIIDELSVRIATGDSRYRKGHIGHLYIFAANYNKKRPDSHRPSYDIDSVVRQSMMFDPTDTKRNC